MTEVKEENVSTQDKAKKNGNIPVTMRQLLESGVHFGHQTRRWNPKMKPFIFTARNSIHVIDLQKTVVCIENAFNFISNVVKQNGTILIFKGK